MTGSAKQSILQHEERMDCFVANAPRNDGWIQLRDLAACFARGLPENSSTLPSRGRRESRALDAPAASRAKLSKAHEHSHYRFTGVTRPSLRNGLRLIARSPRCPGFLAAVACASHRRLDPSVAGSGPHAFAVREHSAVVLSATRVHRIPPRFS